MQKRNRRLLSGLLALTLVMQMLPGVYAEGEEEADEPQVLVELLEEEAEEPEEKSEEETEEEPAEEQEGVAVRFAVAGEYDLTVSREEETVEPASVEEEGVCYLLAPGSYTYRLQVRGFIGTQTDTLEITEGMEPVVVENGLEAYPYGLPGLSLHADAALLNGDCKAFQKENDVLKQAQNLVPGNDYAADHVVISAESEEQAKEIADAYGAELLGFEYGIGTIQAKGVTPEQMLQASLDERLLLPAVELDYIVRIDDPVSEKTLEAEVQADASNPVPGSVSWRTWMDVMGSYADTWLRNPSDEDYHYILDKMNVYKAWGITTGDSDVRLAIIDSGIIANHEELKGRVRIAGYDSSAYSTGDDQHGHGTHCAGIAAASMGNVKGIAGIAPNVSIYSYRALGADGSGSKSSTVKGIRWAISMGVDVISMSLGGTFPYWEEEAAIRDAVAAGITVVVSMGNNGSNMKQYPAGYNIPGMITVGATDAANARAPYSNYGSWCDIMAPGSDILSAGISANNSYVYKSGTSMSTPAVAGACALFMSRFGHRSVTPKDMEKMVKAAKTNGVLDVYKLVTKKYTPKYVYYSLQSENKDVTEWFDAASLLPQNLDICLTSEDTILYTLDGTLPGCLDGVPANGQIYSGAISLADFAVGTRVELNAASITEDGDVGEVTTVHFTVAEPMETRTVTLEAPETLDSGESVRLILRDCWGDELEDVLWTVEGSGDIDENGVLTPNCEGRTELVVRAETADGREAQAVITVINPNNAYLYGITGPDVVLAGKTATFKAQKNVSSSKVTWMLEDVSGYAVSYGYASISTKGVLKVSKYAAHGSVIYVKAMGSDGYTVSKRVTLNQPVTKVHLYGATGGYSTTYSSKTGELTNVTLYSTKSPDYATQNAVTLNVGTEPVTAPILLTTTSKIVTISGKTITAVPGKTGTATVTVKANDGSGKSVKLKVKVVNPASRVDISTNMVKMSTALNYNLAVGKSATHKAVLGNAYGTPSSKKVTWHAELRQSGSLMYNAGYFSISSTGKLTVKKAMSNLVNYGSGYTIDVWATTTDGTNLTSNTIRYNITTPTTFMGFPASGSWYNYNSTWYKQTVKDYEYLSQGQKTYYFDLWIKGASYYNAFIVTSSNPNVATATYASNSGGFLHGNDGDDRIFVNVIGKGTTTITVKATDGTGKTAKLKLTVK